MSRTLTLELSDDEAARAEAAVGRRLEDAVRDWIAAAAAPDDDLASLDVLDDAALWQAARSRFAEELSARAEELHFKRGRDGLTAAEAAEVAGLLRRAERVMLLRARAAELLHARGHDVSCLLRP